MRGRASCCLALAAVALSGCGVWGAGSQTTTQATEAPPPSVRQGWRRSVNRAGGFAIDVPRAWPVTMGGARTLLRSADRSVSGTVIADRGPRGQGNESLAGYANATIRSLPGFRDLRRGAPQDLAGSRYRTVVVRAVGTHARSRVRLAIVIAVARKPRAATCTMAFFLRETPAATRRRPAIARIIRSLHGVRASAAQSRSGRSG